MKVGGIKSHNTHWHMHVPAKQLSLKWNELADQPDLNINSGIAKLFTETWVIIGLSLRIHL